MKKPNTEFLGCILNLNPLFELLYVLTVQIYIGSLQVFKIVENRNSDLTISHRTSY